MTLYVVMGPPAAGKTTWVAAHAVTGDIVIDYDRLLNALTAEGAFVRGMGRPLATVAYQAREAAIREALRHTGTHEVFIIHTMPKPALLAKYKRYRAQLVTVDPGRDVVEERCRAERPDSSMDGVRRWYASHAVRGEAATAAGAVPARTAGASRSW
ncbi:AAA family ATPase [Streptomyces sp. NPDC018019]|uniref:AAA family ATPase n=1 Tax=Streptomyces sp. NPDC018019 TaxID=3365030 RepID=UPI00378F4658